jgi:hypothetical protein
MRIKNLLGKSFVKFRLVLLTIFYHVIYFLYSWNIFINYTTEGVIFDMSKDIASSVKSEIAPSSPKNQGLIFQILRVLRELLKSIGSILMLLPRTISVLMPSVAYTSDDDKKYNQEMINKLTALIEGLELSSIQKATIRENWLEQIEWSNARATRERDANEIIRWWQIILSVLIPTFAQTNPNLVSIFGVLVAVMTAIHQFRRPEERWRHYRVLTERYLIEMWNFITLSGEAYKAQDGKPYLVHSEDALRIFNERMTSIRLEDVSKFFSDVVNTNKADMDELAKRVEELTKADNFASPAKLES